MIDLKSLINLQSAMFFSVAIGIVLGKKNIITKEGRSSLADLLINVILPCSIISSFLNKMGISVLKSSLQVLLLSIGLQLICYLLGKFIYWKADKKHLPILQYGTFASNAAFMGTPIAEGLYGASGLLFASIYLIPQRVYMWTLGLRCFTKTKEKGAVKKVLTHPCIIAVEIGLILMLLPFNLPEFITYPLKIVGNCTTALSMILVGAILSEVKLKGIVSKKILYYCFIRLIVLPLIVLALCMLLKVNTVVSGVMVVLSGMPMASTTAILAAKYDVDAIFASKCVALSTILSLFTIPLWSILLLKIF